MDDIFLIISGFGGVVIALVHGTIGHKKILCRINGLPPALWRVNYAVFQISTFYWIIGGITLLSAPVLLDDTQRYVVTMTVALLYASGAAINFWATRARHFAWFLLVVVATLAFMGA